MKDNIKLSDHFSYKRLIRFTIPSIVMLVFTSVYGVVDGLFVSNFVGKTSFAAVNLIMPVLMILGCIGFMFGTGGGALIAMKLGEGKADKANEIFSLIITVSAVSGVILAALGVAFIKPISVMLGADGKMLDNCILYGRIILAALPFYILQYEFQCLFATAGKPKLGLYVTIAAGVTNMILDALFVAVFSWGLAGAAIATSISQFVGGAIPLIYFAKKNTSLLKLCRFKFDLGVLAKTCSNGVSEFMSNVSASIVGILYNMQLMKYAGENGIAAYGVIMYVNFIFQAIFIGYSVGSAPIVGYNYGSGNKKELKNILKKGLVIIVTSAVLMFVLGQALSTPLSKLFVGYDEELFNITVYGFTIFSFSFLFSGFPILGSSFFTALNNGFISAVISFLRTMVFQIVAVLILPVFFGLNGVWLSVVTAEFLAMLSTAIFLIAKKKKYGY
ncbi:MAG: MATE family efflux transporter [Lachnospira sp.]|nr:MATE family efflux transporter [Lachnospira sp.]MDD5828024.1 MATE family efflux transporter [Lachnospira sp.]